MLFFTVQFQTSLQTDGLKCETCEALTPSHFPLGASDPISTRRPGSEDDFCSLLTSERRNDL